ncbi:MetQ/NlpA family ABC transporter substrate-binding protein [Rhizobium sp. CG5]|uniref:MetQ/NlpA family ABC transporter substrate-binding protein n=1 Tax=Rhizobium sp. CG5 TaxID=2726076 RepID=UPI002033F40E|nr:MetQ/NlpA family ABC transporter substrate-binding protein [Rhizobium sp. CG5]MCM2474974.1 MetQ/NlpA family ABC transporter substrate-binding protein [Rhizobium sp. CG5]
MRLKSLIAGTVSAVALLIAAHAPALAETIKFGVTAGPHAQIAEAVVPIAKAKGLDIQIVEFSDGALIDPATNDGDLDANGFQHTPYLDRQNADRGLTLVAVGGKTVLLPMAGYSRKYKTLAELPEGAQVTIPNDPSNAGRALKLLEAGGLLKLTPGVTFNATELDIIENPKKIKIVPLETAQLPRSLEDVDFSVITSHFALSAGLNPGKDGILIEDQLSDYFCLIAVSEKNKDAPWVKTLVEAYKSPEVKAFIDKKFEGNVIAGW